MIETDRDPSLIANLKNQIVKLELQIGDLEDKVEDLEQDNETLRENEADHEDKLNTIASIANDILDECP